MLKSRGQRHSKVDFVNHRAEIGIWIYLIRAMSGAIADGPPTYNDRGGLQISL
jgi:hypothetical protein